MASEKSYLNDRTDVRAARQKALEAAQQLSLAKRGFKATPSTSKAYQASADAVKKAQAELDKANIEVARVEAAAKADYQKAYKKTEAKKTAAEAKTVDQQIEVETAYLQRLKDSGQSTTDQEAKIKDLIDKKNKTGKYAPKVQTAAGDVVGDQDVKKKPTTDYTAFILSAGTYVKKLSPKDRKDLADNLKRAGFYKGPVLDIYTDELVQAYQTALAANQARSLTLNEDIPWGQFLTDKIAETTALGLGDGTARPTGTQNISTPLEAAAKVEDIFKSELGRMPTVEESAKYSAELIAEEKKASSIIKATPKKIGGVTVNVYTGGLDKDQFLANKIRKLPEYSQRKADTRKLSLQDLAKTAAANGLDLMKDFGSIADSWAKRIENGEDIDTFKNIIRQTAKLGLPDKVGALIDQGVDLETVYSPYRRIMAATLEVDPSSIKLDDPVLRSAYGPDKEMSIFDFKRAVRKDPRWQYTDNAREEVSNTALQILRDFGFQG